MVAAVVAVLWAVMASAPVSASVLRTDAPPRSDNRALFRAFHSALPRPVLDALRLDAQIAEENKDKGLKFGKLSTNWYPARPDGTFPPPRFAAEQAIHYLRSLDFPGNTFAEDGIIGAEWWFQIRDSKGNIGFHYDKDEGTASQEMRMVFPSLSTITYVSDYGSPTLIFNQTTPDGNDNIPIVPNNGGLFYPEENKHVAFDGSLMHGVVGSLGPLHPRHEDNGIRATFLVNWWKTAPVPPNCRPISESVLKQHVEASSHVVGTPAPNPVPAPVHACDLNEYKGELELITLPPSERLQVRLPTVLPHPDRLTLWIEWTHNEAIGGARELDLMDSNVVGHLFASPLPKVIVFYETSEQFTRLEKSVLTVLRPYISDILLYFAPTSKSKDAIRVFGLTTADLPCACIHDTVREEKYRIRKRGNAMTGSDVGVFVKRYFQGNLKAWSPGAHDEL